LGIQSIIKLLRKFFKFGGGWERLIGLQIV